MLWKKEKMRVAFSCDVFQSLLLQDKIVIRSLAKSMLLILLLINHVPNKPVCSLMKSLLEKKNLLVTRSFSFSNSVFYPFEELSTISRKDPSVLERL